MYPSVIICISMFVYRPEAKHVKKFTCRSEAIGHNPLSSQKGLQAAGVAGIIPCFNMLMTANAHCCAPAHSPGRRGMQNAENGRHSLDLGLYTKHKPYNQDNARIVQWGL